MNAGDHPRRRLLPGLLARAESVSLPALLRTSVIAAISGSLVIAGTLAAAYAITRATDRWVEHSRTVTSEARALLVELDHERLHRFDFALTRSPSARADIDSVQGSIARHLDHLIATTAINAEHRARVLEIQRLVNTWQATAPAAPTTYAYGPAATAFARLEGAIATFTAAEDRVYAERVRRAQLAQLLGAVAAGLELAILITVLLLVRRRAIRQATQVEETAKRLEEQRRIAHDAAENMERLLGTLDSLLASAPVGIALYDRQLRCVRANAALAHFDGMRLEDRIGRTPREFLPADVADQVSPLYSAAVERGESNRIEIALHAGDHERRLDVAVFPVRDHDQTIGAGAVMIDITERTKLEAQFRHAQKMEAIGRVAGGVAHDFNNLLTVIRGYVDFLLLDLDAESPLREYAAEIRAGAVRGAALTRQLLAFSRKQVLVPKAVDVNKVIGAMQQMLSRLIASDVRIQLVLRPDIAAVYIDPGQLEQVVMNLAINAADAMPNGGVLTIETASVAFDERTAEQQGREPGEYVALSVIDTGMGMDADTRSRIFEPFFTTKPSGEGTGLGLSTVYGILQQAGGSVTVDSEPGHGSRFTVYLPALADADQVSRDDTAPERSRRGGETILLVEDERGVREAVRRFLVREGYEVLTAQNGREALRVAAAHGRHIDMVISDLVMPELAGGAFVQKLRETRGEIAVLFMSGYTDDAVARRGLLDGKQAFIQKPFALDDLAVRVRQILDVAH